MNKKRSTLVIAMAVICLGLISTGAGIWGLMTSPRYQESSQRWEGPSSAEAPRHTASSTTLTLPGDKPVTLDPALSQDAISARYIVEIFSGLVALDPELEIAPDIAEWWEIGEEGRVYTFHLRENARFHDGKPVTADDFKYAIERACDPRLGSPTAETYLGDVVGAHARLRGQADEVEGVEVLDDHTLRITIDAPKPYFLAKLTHSTAFALDPENVEVGTQRWVLPNGTGPFRLRDYQVGRWIVLERNPHYYREPKPRVDRVVFLLVSSPQAITMYETDQLDAVPVGLNDVERALDPANPLHEELTIAPTLSTFHLGLDTARPPFDDVKVRQAFQIALDRQRLVEAIYEKTVPVAWGIVPPAMPGYDDTALKPLQFDLDRAKELIAESTYGDVSDFPEITLHIPSIEGTTHQVIEAIVGMYEENLGVRIEVEQSDWRTFLEEISRPEHPYQMYVLNWLADYPDPQNFLEVLFHSESPNNHTGYSNLEVDRLLEEARTEQDHDRRMALYRQAEQMILEDTPWVPLYHEVNYWLTKPHVKGMVYPAMTLPCLQYVTLGSK